MVDHAKPGANSLADLARGFLQMPSSAFGTPAHLTRRFTIASTGARLAYYVTGPERGVPIVISAGLGGGVRAWAPVIAELSRRYRIYAWDYRGLYASGPAPSGQGYTVREHAADLGALLDHLELCEPVLAGWSMGVQVTLEAFRDHPRRGAAMIAVHGAPGAILSTAFDSPHFERLSPSIWEAMRRMNDRLEWPLFHLGRSRRVARTFVRVCRQFDIMSDGLEPESFRDMARDWVKLDLATYAEIFERLGEHDATALLPQIDVPALVIGGEKDRFTPLHRSEELVRGLPRSELHVVADATHFGLLEYPDNVAARIARFIEERVGR
ncbi:MAG: alpha/beta hydrolase [Myxococcota bacterium]